MTRRVGISGREKAPPAARKRAAMGNHIGPPTPNATMGRKRCHGAATGARCRVESMLRDSRRSPPLPLPVSAPPPSPLAGLPSWRGVGRATKFTLPYFTGAQARSSARRCCIRTQHGRLSAFGGASAEVLSLSQRATGAGTASPPPKPR